MRDAAGNSFNRGCYFCYPPGKNGTGEMAFGLFLGGGLMDESFAAVCSRRTPSGIARAYKSRLTRFDHCVILLGHQVPAEIRDEIEREVARRSW